MPDENPLPWVLEMLWGDPAPARRTRGLSRERIVAAAIEAADEDGLGALSMARVAERLGCGTMSLYRHIETKDQLLTFMLSAGSGPPPRAENPSDWRGALTDWALGLWEVYHRHPWILHAASAKPPIDPGQLTWLDAGLACLGCTGLAEREKLAAVMAVLHYVRGAAALDIESGHADFSDYSALLRRLVTPDRLPALAAAIADGVFDQATDDPRADFRSGLRQLLDGIGVQIEDSRPS